MRLEKNNKKFIKENKNKKNFYNFENEYENRENIDEDIDFNNDNLNKENYKKK